MAKMITRTIKVYTYITGKFNPVKMQAENIKHHHYPYKLNKREQASLEKLAGGMVLSIETGEALYGMKLDDFLKYAKPIDKDALNGLDVIE